MLQHHHHTPHVKRSSKGRTILKGLAVVTLCYLAFLMYTASQPVRRGRKIRKPTYHKLTLYDGYPSLIPDLLSHPEPHYVLFTSGTFDGSLEGEPWCPDCSVSDPIVRDLVNRAGGSLLEVQVGHRDEWASPRHPARVDKAAPVRYVPTLYHWTQEGAGARISNQLNSDEEVETLRVVVATFMNATAGHSKSVVSVAQLVIESKGKHCGGC
mmetsp:Transcript_27264/g.69415  ORF Transcript_27264/g.69415 Transcript_27264/m.69415 type:complete len:211 (-) Transcript_27264:171-803(-)|eukprot:CAMPEP_0202863416 /NCGR_PEP_ID=MMETSP1391-20130828/4070_1 /ASSEMBLY_ACC=CAM_ASM_000867 /TAXON_ID=1034604 /ORGANISM="Chlamydomonas leiostraca, Strain SAG 11-49" /LENGTH=210 /DNA_ID=CAMNT_0049543053 /DNA_START=50 /DNA_END=682 /DNA_ORIENTATION=+